MTDHARGTFDVELTPGEPDSGFGRYTLVKTWHGDLSGTGRGVMLSAGDPGAGEAGYVAVETFEGSLAGREGTFAFQQLGRLTGGTQTLTYQVVPGSGTGELAGLDGELTLDTADGGHAYALRYTFS